MRGIMSSAPAPSAIRLLVGTHLLLLVQALLVIRSAPAPDGMLRAIIIVTSLLAITALIAAVRGESGPDDAQWWRRDHVR